MKKQDPEGVTLAGTLLNDSFESAYRQAKKSRPNQLLTIDQTG